ncbi:hypothetical protein LCGC14_2157820 [marine sediment metagenome]|uniref:Uncharacterized protein n=1 Tax=marine sediment metagenome TaxID=412755 RepID=A0A0F9G6H6_9ZZZZ
MMDEARYRGAWVRFYRAIVLPKTSPVRPSLLQQAISEVKKFADAEDNSSGVKFASLTLAGMAARELKEWKVAASFLRRADVKGASWQRRLKAKFETVRIAIDRKQFAAAATQIKAFKTQGAKLPKVAPEAVAMQGALLGYKLNMVQAEGVKSNPAAYALFKDKASKELLDFVEEYPRHREAFWDLLPGLFDTANVEQMAPAMRIALAGREAAKKTPEGDARAEELLTSVAKSDKAGGGVRASAMWRLGLLYNRQRKNLKAAEVWCALAEKYPKDANGKKHDWRAELVAELAARQQPDGSWVNENSRWLEGNPNLVTGYVLLALSYAKK